MRDTTQISLPTTTEVDSVMSMMAKRSQMRENNSRQVQLIKHLFLKDRNPMSLDLYCVRVVPDRITSITPKQQRKWTSKNSKIISGQSWI
jgi:hypothetical protein